MGGNSVVAGSSGDVPAPIPVRGSACWRDSEVGKSHSQRFEYFLKSGLRSDVTFLLGIAQKAIKAHKLILSVGSEVFFDLFRESESTNTIEVPDFEPEEFTPFLIYLYTGETSRKVEDALPLLILTSKYKVLELMEWCQELLKNAVELDTTILIFQQSRKFCHRKLEEMTLKFISENAYKMIESPQFLELTCDNLGFILARDELDVDSETDLFEAVMKWTMAECKRQNQPETPETLRSVLEKVIHLIRFPQMDPSDFRLKVAPAQVLTTVELVSVLQYFDAKRADRESAPTGLFNSNPRGPQIPEAFNVALSNLTIKPWVLKRMLDLSNTTKFNFPVSLGPHTLRFRANTPFWITSLGMNCQSTAKVKCKDTFLVEILLINSKRRIIAAKKANRSAAKCRATAVHIQFDSPVYVRANEWHTAAFIIISGKFYGKAYYKGPEIGNRNKIYTHFKRDDGTEGEIKFEFQDDLHVEINYGYTPEIAFQPHF